MADPTTATAPSPYETYTLRQGTGDTCCTIVPERGGILTQWRVGGVELLYLDEARFRNPALSVRGGIPILFPICGNLPEDTYTLDGQTYSLKQHGFARALAWSVAAEVEGDTPALSLVLTSDEATRTAYPFEFSLEYSYHLGPDYLEIRQLYQNHSQRPMPLSYGFHPYFGVGDKTQLRFEIPADTWWDKQTGTAQSFGGAFDFDQPELDMAFYPVAGNEAVVIDLERQIRLTLSYDALFTTLVFWTVKDQPFFCLEPWSAPRNALNTGEALTHLAPGSRLATWIRLQVAPL